MTRYRIFALVTLVVTLVSASQATVASAHDVCGDPPRGWCVPIATDDGGNSPAGSNAIAPLVVAAVAPPLSSSECNDEMVCPWMYEPTAAGTAPVVEASEQQRYLEESTTAANTVPYYRTIDGATYYDRLTSQRETGCNDEMRCLSMYSPIQIAARQCTHPTSGFPTCYSLQDDGTWEREELIGVNSGWVVVGTVTFDEMRAAVGEVSASIP